MAKTAINLGLPKLYTSSINSLVNNMAVDNVLEMVEFGEEMEDSRIRVKAVQIVKHNLKIVWGQKRWRQVMKKHPDFLLDVMDTILNF